MPAGIDMKLIDMHCDTVYKLWKEGSTDFYDNRKLCIDIRRLREADSLVQCLALYEDWVQVDEFDRWMEYAAFEKALIAAYPDDLEQVFCFEDIQRIRDAGKIGILLTVENAHAADGHIERIDQMAALGARILSLTWNYETCFGYPNSWAPDLHAKGLKEFGRETIARLNELNVLLDVSHLSRGGTLEALSISKQPVLASHSNARAIMNQPRNLSDEEIRGIAETGGVIGVNFVPSFMSDDRTNTFDNIARHTKYLANVGGDGIVAFGSDFDGCGFADTDDVTHMGAMPRLYEELKKRGFTEAFLEGMFHKNLLRVFREVM